MLITKSEFAAHLSVTRPRITALIKRGLPVEASGKIDLEAAEAWLRSNGVPQARFGDRGVSRVVGGPSPPLTPSPVPPASVSTASTPAPKRQPDKTAKELPVISQEPGIEESEFQASPRRALPPAPTPPGAFNLLAEKARETHFRADKAELDFKERNGQLLDAAATESKWSRIIADARNRLLACPGRIASRIGHLQKSEVDVIDREIRNALTELGE